MDLPTDSRSLVVHDWYSLTPVGIKVNSEPTYHEWEAEVEFWIQVNEVTPMILGDLLNYGEMLWPEEYAQVVDAYRQRYKPQTLRNYKSVMARVAPEVRIPELGFGHYDAVAALPAPEQAEVLQLAAKTGLSREETRDLVRERRHDDPPRRFSARVMRVGQEVRGSVVAIVLEDPIVGSEEGQLPSGLTDVTLREVP